MNNQIRQPLVNSRTISSRSSSNFDKTLSNQSSFEDPLNTFLNRKQPPYPSKGSQSSSQSAFRNSFQLFKTDPNLMAELLDKYTQANLFYRDEEFSQQADLFLTKIAMERKIPDEFRVKYPLYQILVSLAKIFMLNEFEIVVFGCLLDHCPWNIEDVLTIEDGSNLWEFPSNFGLDISIDCKRFIIYLLIITFALKQYLGDKNEVDQIQAYCENICNDFQGLFNKWVKISTSSYRFNYSLPEVNRKYRYLAKRDLNGYQSNVKDFNMIVDEIMGLTGSYTTRAKETRHTGHATPYMEPSSMISYSAPQKTQIFHDLPSDVVYQEPKPLQGGTATPYLEDKSYPKLQQNDSYADPNVMRMPSFLKEFSRQPSFSALLANLPMTRRQPSFENYDDMVKKKVKGDDSHGTTAVASTVPSFQNQSTSFQPTLQNQPSYQNYQNQPTLQNMPSYSNQAVLQSQPSFFRDSSTLKAPELNPSFSSLFKHDDLLNMNLPMLSKKASRLSNEAEDLPSLSRFQSNLSFLYDNNK